MPHKPIARCTTARCPHLKPCPTHTPARARQPDTRQRPTTCYTDPLYRHHRTHLLANNPHCEWCGDPATTVDHWPPTRRDETYIEWEDRTGGELVPACAPCNYGHHQPA